MLLYKNLLYFYSNLYIFSYFANEYFDFNDTKISFELSDQNSQNGSYVHCEIKLVSAFYEQIFLDNKNFKYMGLALKSCPLCSLILDNLNLDYCANKANLKSSFNWEYPNGLENSLLEFVKIKLKEFNDLLKKYIDKKEICLENNYLPVNNFPRTDKWIGSLGCIIKNIKRPNLNMDYQRLENEILEQINVFDSLKEKFDTRPKINLEARKNTLDNILELPRPSSIFGQAKPVDTAKREREIERKFCL